MKNDIEDDEDCSTDELFHAPSFHKISSYLKQY